MKKNEAKKKMNAITQVDKLNDTIINILLTILTVISFFITLLSLDGNWLKKCVVVSIAVTIAIFILFIVKIVIIKKSHIPKGEYIREQKINQINKGVFDSLYKSNFTKVREVFRYTYGKVPEWNPINYRDNVLVYDVHEQIRSILISIEEVVINIDPERFNDNNVSVELVYCYPTDGVNYTLPVEPVKSEDGEKNDDEKKNKDNHPWKLISSGDTSGNQQSVLEYLSQETSFYTLVDCCGTVYKNNKCSEIEEYQYELLDERFKSLGKRTPSEQNFFIKDIRDWEGSVAGNSEGTAIGTVINIRNDNPEKIFVKAILTINTYGEPIFVDDSDNKKHKKLKRDKFSLTEEDYKKIFCNTILSTYTKLLETELAQMYIRHAIRNRDICPKTGRKLSEEQQKTKCSGCEKCSIDNNALGQTCSCETNK